MNGDKLRFQIKTSVLQLQRLPDLKPQDILRLSNTSADGAELAMCHALYADLKSGKRDLIASMVQSAKIKEEDVAADISNPLPGAPPKRNGNVLQLNLPKSLVEVSIGHDDGIRNGHMLEVTRDGRYIGKLRVRNTEPNRAVGEILQDRTEAIIEKGDRVETTIQ